MRGRKQRQPGTPGPEKSPVSEVDRARLAAAAEEGLAAETRILRLLIRQAMDEGHPAGEIARLIDCLARVLRTKHVLTGANAKQLDEALATALDKIAVEIGATL